MLKSWPHSLINEHNAFLNMKWKMYFVLLFSNRYISYLWTLLSFSCFSLYTRMYSKYRREKKNPSNSWENSEKKQIKWSDAGVNKWQKKRKRESTWKWPGQKRSHFGRWYHNKTQSYKNNKQSELLKNEQTSLWKMSDLYRHNINNNNNDNTVINTYLPTWVANSTCREISNEQQ